jgi:hypothetical protein
MKATRFLTNASLLVLLSALSVQEAIAQTLYWTDIGTSKIQRFAPNCPNGIEDLLTTPVVFTPVGIALDVSGGKMYWTEQSVADFMIQRADLDGSNVELLVTGLVSPSGIALDVTGGKMYWTDIGASKIQRANLDGSNVEDLVTTGVIMPRDIALDVAGGKIYWTEGSPADFMILRADLNGANVEFLVTALWSPYGIALDLHPAIEGDIDGDCAVDFDDLNALVAVLLGVPLDPAHVARADLNGDGNNDGKDIQLFVDAILAP